MRMLNHKADLKMEDLILYLTKDGTLTFCLYDKENIEKYGFNKKSVKLIMNDG